MAEAAALLRVVMVALAALLLLHSAGVYVHAQNTPQDFVDAHNSARSSVGVGPVTWNDTVAAYAEDYADTRAGDCSLVFSNGTYGENIFVGTGGTEWTAADAVALWLSFQKYYSYSNNSCTVGFESQCEAYTQLVWAKSVTIGCGRVDCTAAGGVFIVCEYYPPGNVPGERPY